MTALQLALDGDTLSFVPGAQILVTASWNLGVSLKNIELRLFWYTQGKGDSDVHVVQQLAFPNPELQETKRLAIRLPDAPYSFSGKLISLIWAIELVAEKSNEAARLEFVMAPGAREVILDALPQYDDENDGHHVDSEHPDEDEWDDPQRDAR
jgi:hypothetical protein